MSGSPTIHQPSFLVVGDRSCKRGDENDLLLLLFGYIGFILPLVLRFFIHFNCRCMVYVDVCSFVRHRFCPLGWQRMGDVDFVVPFVFSEDEMMWRTIVGAL